MRAEASITRICFSFNVTARLAVLVQPRVIERIVRLHLQKTSRGWRLKPRSTGAHTVCENEANPARHSLHMALHRPGNGKTFLFTALLSVIIKSRSMHFVAFFISDTFML